MKSKQSGTDGIGNHKHGISGRVPTNKANALHRARQENKKIEEKEKLRKLRKTKMSDSVRDLFKR